jgi:hypothetical protein
MDVSFAFTLSYLPSKTEKLPRKNLVMMATAAIEIKTSDAICHSCQAMPLR